MSELIEWTASSVAMLILRRPKKLPVPSRRCPAEVEGGKEERGSSPTQCCGAPGLDAFPLQVTHREEYLGMLREILVEEAAQRMNEPVTRFAEKAPPIADANITWRS